MAPYLSGNVNALCAFDSTDPNAYIYADGQGQLKVGVKGMLSQSESDFEHTVSVIEQIYQETLEESTLPIEENPPPELLKKVKEKNIELLTIITATQNIFQAYKNRSVKGIERLEELTEIFPVTQEVARKNIQKLNKKISELKLHEQLDFTEISSEEEINAGAYSHSPKTSSWFYRQGEGPSWLGKAYSAMTTTAQLIQGTFSAADYTPDPVFHEAQARVANPGRQLASGDMERFVKALKINTIDSFYKLAIDMPGRSLETIKGEISTHKAYFKEGLPLVIPIVFSKQAGWERQHIAVVTIKDNCVEYYDSKGIVSKHKLLPDGHNLREVLEYLKEEFTDDGFIVENPYEHQFDAHNCGVFVCRHIYRHIEENLPMGILEPKAPPIQEITSFRKTILEVSQYQVDQTVPSVSLEWDEDL